MSFFRNDAINRVNLQSGVQALAQGLGHVFFLVFLLRAGVPIPLVLLSQAGIVTLRFIIRPTLLPLAVRWGLKPMLIAGSVAMAAQYPILAEVRGVGPMLLLLCVVASLGEVLYWVSFNAYFARVGDAEHRGHQSSAREALTALANVAAPLAGAWALISLGPRWAFAAAGLIQIASVLPLLGAPQVKVASEAPGVFQGARPALLLMATDGWFDAGFFFVWQIALFLSLGESIGAYGGAMALAGLLGATLGLLMGRHVDAGHGRRAAAIAYGAAALVVALRAASLGTPWMAVAANALGALVMPILVPPLVTATANMSQASPCTFRFGMATEAGWDLGCFFACVSAAGLVWAGVSLQVCVLLALPGALAGWWLLRGFHPPKV